MRKMICLAGAIVLFPAVPALAGGTNTPEPVAADPHCLKGCPHGAPETNRLIERSIYTLSNNGTTRFAQWIAYIVTTDSIGKSKSRVWRKDPDLPEDETLSPADYKNANRAIGTDRGHQAPLASFSGAGDWAMTNYLSNITPQKSPLNRGPWKALESAVRVLAKTGKTVHVMTGPLFGGDMETLPANGAVTIPNGYWKILAIDNEGRLETASFIMAQNLPQDADMCAQGATIDQIEKGSGLDFFNQLPNDDEEALESGPAVLMNALGCPPQQE